MEENTNLGKSIRNLKGIGPKKASLYEKLGIRTMEDVLYSFPRDYENRSNRRKICDLIPDEMAFVQGEVVKVGAFRGRRRPVQVLVRDDTAGMEVTFFNAGYLSKSLKRGTKIWLFGKVEERGGMFRMTHPQWGKWEEEEKETGILPIYPLTEGLKQTERRKLTKQILTMVLEEEGFSEFLPEETIERNQLCGIQYALVNIHFPGTERMQKVAKYRLIFEEFLVLQTGLTAVRNRMNLGKKGICFQSGDMEAFYKKLPYQFTRAQKRTVDEILRDMESDKMMNRLIQGDVGSGKTAVAAAAIYKAVISGYQAVLMAPTEILAKQHLETFEALFQGLTVNCGSTEETSFLNGEMSSSGEGQIQIGFLSGSLTGKARKAVLEDLEMGRIHILIGTHALIQPGVNFQNLGLVVTDEQHRFGVAQREMLSKKGMNCDILVMTATPIPRTLALTLYGDLDISIIDEKPAGRKEIKTAAFEMEERKKVYRFVYKELKAGRQAYVVAPLVEMSESLEAKSAEELYDELQGMFFEFRVALLHGRMKQEEKDAVMDAFQRGEVQMLVSTVVIEVGINVPNATVMVLENAERFGLAQMHQLRGRVGRGKHQSYCMLISALNTDVARERAEVMVKTNDGFIIAEKDLLLRGPGEFFGTRQHGIPELRIGDLARHPKLLKAASDEAKKIMEEDPLLEHLKNQKLKERVQYWLHGIDDIQR